MAATFVTGQIILLTDTLHGHTLRFVVEEKNKGKNFLLARPSNPYARLHLTQNRKVSFEAQQGPGSFFTVMRAPGTDDGVYRLQSATQNPTVCIGLHQDGSLHAQMLDEIDDDGGGDAALSVCFRLGSGDDAKTVLTDMAPPALRPWELRRFVTEGFVLLRGCVRRDVLRRCDRALTRAWAVPGSVVAGGTQGDGVGKLAGCWSNCSAVRDLFLHSSGGEGRRTVRGVVEALLGPGNVDVSAGGLSAQIAFRFPEPAVDETDSAAEPEDDDDDAAAWGAAFGRSWHTDGLRQGKAHPFSLLVGVCLSDVATERAGNLLVWPGSHLLLHRCKAGPHGALDPALLQQAMTTAPLPHKLPHPEPQPQPQPQPRTSSSSLSSETAEGAMMRHVNEPADLPDLGPPLAVLAHAGDVVLLHPDTAHAGGPNLSGNVRKMVYFRVKVKAMPGDRAAVDSERDAAGEVAGNAAGTWERVCTAHAVDPWADLPGAQDALADLRRALAP